MGHRHRDGDRSSSHWHELALPRRLRPCRIFRPQGPVVEELELQVETRLFNEFGMHEAASKYWKLPFG